MDSQSDSRKRPLDTDSDDGITKRSNQGPSDSSHREDLHLKMLVPSCAAGAVIGKGGETIGKIQRETGAKMKMSKNQDVFPGTAERVCLIIGTIHSVQAAHDEVAEIIMEKPDPHPKPSTDGDGKLNYSRHQQTKLVIPNASAGVIIGKGGAYIKDLKDQSGAHVNVSPKGDNPERIVTVSGDREEVRAALQMILEKLAADPQSASYPTLNYSSSHSSSSVTPSNSYTSMSNGSTMNMGGNMGGGAMTPQQVQQAAQSLSNMMRTFSNLGTGINNLNIGTRPRNPAIEQLVSTLKMTGYTDAASDDIANALSTLSNYGLLNLAGGGSSLLGNLLNLNRIPLSNGNGLASKASDNTVVTSAATSQSSQLAPTSKSAMLNSHTSSVSSLTNAAGLASGVGSAEGKRTSQDAGLGIIHQLAQIMSSTQSPASSQTGNMRSRSMGALRPDQYIDSLFTGNSGMFNADSMGASYKSSGSPEQQDSQEIEVPESLAGAVIGQQGRGITEIQALTGASVSVSRRGVYAPGTNNRIVTISGPSSGVERATLVVRQKIQDAEQRRAQSSF